MTGIAILILLVAALLGAATSHLAFRFFPIPRWRRALFLLLTPFAIYFAWFLSYGWPKQDDWPWFWTGLVFVWPFFIAWGVGCVLERVMRPSATLSEH